MIRIRKNPAPAGVRAGKPDRRYDLEEEKMMRRRTGLTVLAALWAAMAMGSGAGAEEAVFEAFLQDTLIPERGVAIADQAATIRSPDERWLELSGILTTAEADLDGDGAAELLVLGVDQGEQYQFYAEVYENQDGQIAGPSRVDWYTMEVAWCYTDLNIDLVASGGKTYIAWENYEQTAAFANGQSQNYGAWVYENGQLQPAFAFLQTDGGSCDFAFTGYEYENGQTVREELLYADMSDLGAPYATIREAMTALYGKYGIALDGEKFNEMGGKDFTCGSVISEENQVVRVMNYNINCTYYDPDTQAYDFVAGLTEYSGLYQNSQANAGGSSSASGSAVSAGTGGETQPQGTSGETGETSYNLSAPGVGTGAILEDTEPSGGETAVSTEDAVQLLLDYYNNQSPDDGTYVAFDSEITDNGDTCLVVVRYQISNEEAAEIMARGGTPSANQLVDMVEVNKTTGEATGGMGTAWNLW